MNQNAFKRGYSDVNGLKMYYEIYGKGDPLVLIHGGGSTIQSSFGNIIPLCERNRQVIAMELQAHGRNRIIPDCQLAILPGKHGAYLGTSDYVNKGKWLHPYAADLIDEFL